MGEHKNRMVKTGESKIEAIREETSKLIDEALISNPGAILEAFKAATATSTTEAHWNNAEKITDDIKDCPKCYYGPPRPGVPEDEDHPTLPTTEAYATMDKTNGTRTESSLCPSSCGPRCYIPTADVGANAWEVKLKSLDNIKTFLSASDLPDSVKTELNTNASSAISEVRESQIKEMTDLPNSPEELRIRNASRKTSETLRVHNMVPVEPEDTKPSYTNYGKDGRGRDTKSGGFMSPERMKHYKERVDKSMQDDARKCTMEVLSANEGTNPSAISKYMNVGDENIFFNILSDATRVGKRIKVAHSFRRVSNKFKAFSRGVVLFPRLLIAIGEECARIRNANIVNANVINPKEAQPREDKNAEQV